MESEPDRVWQRLESVWIGDESVADRDRRSPPQIKTMNIKPLFDKVILEETEVETVSPMGIVVVGAASDLKVRKAQVLAVGPGKYAPNGDFVPTSVQVGSTVLTALNAGEAVKIDGTTVRIICEADILAVVG